MILKVIMLKKMSNIVLESEFRAIGTDIYIQIVIDNIKDKEIALKDIETIKNFYKKKEKILSRFDPGSELFKLNNHLNKFIGASEDILYLAKKSLEYYKKTDGLFDPRILELLESVGYKKDFKKNIFDEKNIPKNKNIGKNSLDDDLEISGNEIMFRRKMDFSGIAKGYITDKAAEILKEGEWRNFLIDSGGDMYASGLNRDGESWKISLEDSAEPKKSIIGISDQGIATSGVTRKKWKIGKEKFHHLINPKNPNDFNFDVKSVTVVSNNAEKADVVAKTLFLMGPKKGIIFSNENEIESVFLLKDNNLIFSKYFK